MDTTRLKSLLDKYLDNTCTETEMQELFELFKRAGNEPEVMQYLKDFWSKIPGKGMKRPKSLKETDEWFNAIHSQALDREGISTGRKTRINTVRKPGLLSYNNKNSQWIKVAAILVLSLSLSLFYFTLAEIETIEEVAYEVKTPGPGEKIRFTLPDGTQVHLNSGSKLEYPVSFGEKSRDVHLEGEAYFVVARNENHPFLVHTRDITTEVLGTSFNVRSYQEDSDVQVAVSSGKVALSDPNFQGEEHQVILEANQWAHYAAETRSFQTGSSDITAFTAWNEGVLLYHDKALSDVAVQLERWYGVSISFDGDAIKDCVIRGEHRDETLVNVLQAITYAFDITYQIEGRNVVLSGNDCF